MGRVVRYRCVREIEVRDRPALAGAAVLGKRAAGRLIRTDQEFSGWVRLQEDFYAFGKSEPIEGWALKDGSGLGQGALLHEWEPASLPSAVIGSISAQGSKTARYWAMPKEGIPVRERPWGRVLCTKRRGALLRVDKLTDGWARLEQDFDEEGPLLELGSRDDEAPVLEGWVLLDGRELGLPRQCQLRAGEAEPPAEEPRPSEDELAARRNAKLKGHEARGEDYGLRAVCSEAKVSDEVVETLEAAGVTHLDELVRLISRGDHHEELRRCGVAKIRDL
jgi:hypothetical protein